MQGRTFLQETWSHILLPHMQVPGSGFHRGNDRSHILPVVPANTIDFIHSLYPRRCYHLTVDFFCLRVSDKYGCKHIYLCITQFLQCHQHDILLLHVRYCRQFRRQCPGICTASSDHRPSEDNHVVFCWMDYRDRSQNLPVMLPRSLASIFSHGVRRSLKLIRQKS